ncbi:fatty acid desaturase [Synechococcus sp. CS-1325]|uniref:fatty acid desaturase n=1 Tax=unclassified Synechococcus TaxID=2626047 RepID=UPI000DB0FCCC|nr:MULTISPECIES: fatty acid desaturase [unclassified Synechococcus]MCT0198873.1 fatty acid desaturase [Synechococcus sp. CS-1325]MCT0212133.1 fatty acid desaturase [Synechococcus sp. CS-1326]MCT0232921.1 fatty acid desaturase [Synechococcus sp. CS-1327]PZV00094.1 MAG: fatty acid desaturase [Cyanobium sp.]
MTTTIPRSAPFPSPSAPPQSQSDPGSGNWPTKQQLLACLPADITDKNSARAWRKLAFSLSTSLLAYGLGCLIPLQWAFAPLWLAYAVVAGTLAMGCWVLAHECGHNAFHPNRTIEAGVGLVLHSLLLVPYFSWQRSHAVHHSHCNHLEAGETHVPSLGESPWAGFTVKLKRVVGESAYGMVSILVHLLLGWPLYLLFGITGGPEQGFPTSHFIDSKPFNTGRRPLFPGKWKDLMHLSNAGLIVVLALLLLWASQTSMARVLCVYGLPYLIINAWLVCYTWLQHTDAEIPHFSESDWDWAKGALQTVDRPYGPLLNLLHHGIGSTHVAHHLNPRIPHYNAWRATEILRAAFPEHVRVDPTPIHQALWRVGRHCSYVTRDEQNGGYYYS